MLFVSGPRQAGKTSLANLIAGDYTNRLYWNWDIPEHKLLFLKTPSFFSELERKDESIPLIVFDEIHKYRDWKNYLKGVYDQFAGQFHFLVSGSGRLDIYQRGSDSLAGRYLSFHLWPFSMSELSEHNLSFETWLKNPLQTVSAQHEHYERLWHKLAEQSGFPEPFLSDSVRSYRRWSRTYATQIIREDIRDISGIKSIGDMETFYLLLSSKIGSPLSLTSLANDLRVSYNTVQSWLTLLERFFLCFLIRPWTTQVVRAIQKEKKLYLWDSPRIADPALRFENMTAIELWRAVTIWNDLGLGDFSLHFLKNKEQNEVDFLIANRNKPIILIETKLNENRPSPHLVKFQRMLNVPAVQLTNKPGGFKLFHNQGNTILVAPAWLWLPCLPFGDSR